MFQIFYKTNSMKANGMKSNGMKHSFTMKSNGMKANIYTIGGFSPDTKPLWISPITLRKGLPLLLLIECWKTLSEHFGSIFIGVSFGMRMICCGSWKSISRSKMVC